MGILAVLGSALCFGTTGTTQQLGVPDISPLAVGAARLLCGSLFLFAFAFCSFFNLTFKFFNQYNYIFLSLNR